MKKNDPLALFNALREKEVNKSSGISSGSFGNPNLFKLKQGASYALRLLWLPPAEGFNREYPMINQYIHRIWDENAIGSKDVKVYCHTSQYDLGETKAGFACPICKAMSAAYKQGAEGSTSAQELYKKFRRTFQGYVPVYVVNGPEEDRGQIKILQFTKSFKDSFDSKIFGINKDVDQNNEDGNVVDEEMIGIDAFMYYNPSTDEVITNGNNFVVTVKTKRVPINGKMVDMPDYKFDFSRKTTEVTDFNGEEITPERFIGLSEELGFDRDFYKFSTDEEILEFKAKYIDGEEFTDNDLEENVETHEDETLMETLTKNKKPTSKPVEKNPIVEEEENETETINDIVNDEPETDEIDESNDEDIDLDELLKDL
jgi:hypothetical protein